jgi:hypothetical protein
MSIFFLQNLLTFIGCTSTGTSIVILHSGLKILIFVIEMFFQRGQITFHETEILVIQEGGKLYSAKMKFCGP